MLLVWMIVILQAKVYIDSGGKCYLHEDVILHTNGSLVQNGEIIPDGGAFRFWGPANTAIIGATEIELDGLDVDKSNGAILLLRSQVRVSQWLRLGSGTLQSTGTRSENPKPENQLRIESARKEVQPASVNLTRNADKGRKCPELLERVEAGGIENGTARKLVAEVSITDRFVRDGNLTLSSGADIIRSAGMMSFLPNLDGWFDVIYEGGCITGNEIPAGTTGLRFLTLDLPHGVVVLGCDVLVNRALTINGGTLDTDEYTLTMGPNAIVDGDPGDITGVIEGESVAVGAGEYSSSALGFHLTAGNDLGNLQLLVFTEPVTWEGHSGIARRWRIEADNQPSGRDMTLSWYASADNGSDLTTMQVWRSPDGGNSWFAVGDPVDISGTGDPRSVTITNVASFSDYTLTDGDNTLPVTLSSFTATTTSESLVQLDWVTQSESNMLGYHVQRNQSDELDSAIRLTVNPVEAMNQTQECEYRFIDQEVETGNTYWYWLESIETGGSVHFFGPVSVEVIEEDPDLPPEYFDVTALKENYPNPFNPETTIVYSLSGLEGSPEQVSIVIYNARGQRIRTLIDGVQEPGSDKIVVWNGLDDHSNPVSSGVYFVRMKTAEYSNIRKVLLMK